MNDADEALKHLAKIVTIADAAARRDWALFQHDYLFLCFGSFTVEFGTRKKRRRYSWDGRDGFLDIQDSDFSDSRSPAKWKPIRNLKLPFDADQPYRTILEDIGNEEGA
jgi:hypothetical protein